MTGDLALISTTDSEIAPFFALNHIFLPAKGKALLKTQESSDFKACLK